jgi:hypothetical protein
VIGQNFFGGVAFVRTKNSSNNTSPITCTNTVPATSRQALRVFSSKVLFLKELAAA